MWNKHRSNSRGSNRAPASSYIGGDNEDEQQYPSETLEDRSVSLSQDFRNLNVGFGWDNNFRDATPAGLSSLHEDSQVGYGSSPPSSLSRNYQYMPYDTPQSSVYSSNSRFTSSNIVPPPRPNTVNFSRNFRSNNFDYRQSISGNQASTYYPRDFESSGLYGAYESRPFEQPDISEEPDIQEPNIQEEPEVSGQLQQYQSYSDLLLNYEVSHNRSIGSGYPQNPNLYSFPRYNSSNQYCYGNAFYDNTDDTSQVPIGESSEAEFAQPQGPESEVFDESYEDNRSSSKQEFSRVTNPLGYFQLGRVFIASHGSEERAVNDGMPVVVISRDRTSVTCYPFQPSQYMRAFSSDQNDLASVGIRGATGSLQTEFPLILENDSIYADRSWRINFSDSLVLDQNIMVRNVGRIDRDHKKRLRERVFGEVENHAYDDGDIAQEDDGRILNDAQTSSRRNYTQSKGQKPHNDKGRMGKSSKNLLGMQSSSKSKIKSNKKPPTTALGKSQNGSASNVLDSRYKVHPSKDFRVGMVVISILWSEPAGQSGTEAGMEEYTQLLSKYGENAYHSIRRFIAIRNYRGHCLCLPILTYGGQGTLKSGCKLEDHGIIFSDGQSPKALPEENEMLLKKPIRVVMEDKSEQLNIASRINYAKIYTVEHNTRVRMVGKVHEDDKNMLSANYQSTQGL